MEVSPNLSLPYILAAQSQKHVTHNEAIRALDAIVQLGVADRDLSAPPPAPVEGERHIVAAGASSAWTGQSGKVAAFQDGAWAFYAPSVGWLAWVADESRIMAWDGAGWVEAAAAGVASLNPATGGLVGVNATADTTNRLSVKSLASLFDNVGNGHQQKINKAAAGDTASQLYQTGYSGRAEIGLTGDDNFHFKVSADGSTWKDAIQIDKSTGAVTMPFTTLSGGREKLSAARTYYIRTDGNDANTGLANTSGGAWRTRQKAWNTIVGTLDLGGQTVTVQMADGTYDDHLVIVSGWTGGGSVVFNGNAASPAAVHVNSTSVSFANVWVTGPCPNDLVFKNMKMSAPNHSIFDIRAACQINLGAGEKFHFGASLYGHIFMDAPAAFVKMYGGEITIAGGSSSSFAEANSGAMIYMHVVNLVLSGTPGFPGAFARAAGGGNVRMTNLTITGTATGPRYQVGTGGIVNTNGGGASYLPGNSAGSGTGYY